VQGCGSNNGHEVVPYQQQLSPWKLRMREATYARYASRILPKSRHEAPRFLFDEDFLSREAADDASLRDRLALPRRLFDKDWFDYFPQRFKPAPKCIVVAGAGARSTFHRDPFEWTGTSICLQGTKLWTFLPPGKEGVGAIDQAFNAYRFRYDSSDSEEVSLAAGWQADVDLYAVRAEHCPSAAELAELPRSSREELVEQAAEVLRKWWCKSDPDVVPPLQPPESTLECLPSDVTPTCVVQRAGELLLIPAHWWHQTYALEPSIAVSGQYMNEANSRRVMQHIATWLGVEMPSQSTLQPLPPKERVDRFLCTVLGDDCLEPEIDWEELGFEFDVGNLL